MEWWTIPGPRSFLDAVIGEVREGKSVFLILPENAPGRLSHALRESFREDCSWERMNVLAGEDPVDFLCAQIVPDPDPRRLRSAASLASEESFQRKLIWIEEISEGEWAKWSHFFLEYERVCRVVPESRRSLFLIRRTGAGAVSPPTAVGLGTVRWDGWLRSHDIAIYSNGRIRARTSALETDLTTALVSELGGWDPTLCEYMADFALPDLIQPGPLLERYAVEKGWRFEPGPYDEAAWSKGLWQTYLGKQTPHSCYGAFLFGPRFLNRLLWKAEIGILMPYIEEKRQELIEQYRKHIKLPFCSKYGVFNDVYDLEIGLLELALSQSGAPGRTILDLVRNLKLARNQLSHLAAVDSSVLLSLCEEG